jgi:VCBS repeat-containing protein
VASGTPASAAGQVGSGVAGAHGTLVLNGDGSYTYTLDNASRAVQELNAGETASDVFTYTLTDADGDTSTATLTITITGTDDGVGLTIPDMNGTAGGQASVPEDQVTSGSFTISAPDGLDPAAALTVAGTPVSLAALQNSGSVPIPIATTHGTLTITGYDPATGTVSYGYDPSGTSQDHSGGDVLDDIAIVVRDDGGETQSGTLTIEITDTAPTAHADTNAVTEDAAPNPVTGNVITTGPGADTLGADAAAVTGIVSGTGTPGHNVAAGSTSAAGGTTVAGLYGTLVLGADGSYGYTLDNANPVVNALKDGDSLSEVYTYTLTDADGDASTVTLTIAIHGHTDGGPAIAPVDGNGAADGQATVYEQGLASVGDTSETTTGTIAVSAPDGLKSITVGGTSFTAAQLADAAYLAGHPVDTGEGTLTLTGYAPATGTLSYSYTLKSALDQPGAVDSLDAIALSVTDAADATAAGTLTVRIVDSVPVAHADINAVTEDTAPTASGNVITLGAGADTLGADAATTVTGVAAGTHASAAGQVGSGVAGAYGTLTLASGGGYTYVLDNASAAIQALATGQTVTDTFTYTITDADGDTSTTTLTLTVNGTNDAPDITVQAGDSAAAALSETDAGLTAGGTLSIGDVDTLDTVTPSVFSVTAGGTYAGLASLSSLVTNAQLLAMLAVTGGESSTTAQDNPHGIAWAFDSGSQAFNFLPVGETLTLTYVVRATDNHGASDDQPVTITITGTNDGITLHDDARTIAENANAAGRSGNVLTNDVLDQDYGQVTQVTGFSLDANGDGNAENYLPGASVTITSASGGTLGVFTLAADGVYSFTPYQTNYSGPVPVVTYTAGSSTNSATATLTLTVSPVSDAPGVTRDAATVTTPEDTAVALGLNAPTVSDATDQNGAVAGDDPERLSLITLSGIPSGAQLLYGSSTYTSTGAAVTIFLSDAANQITNHGTATLTMTTAEFEALQVRPVADSAANFTVSMSVTEYEVDASGVQLSGVLGATSTTTVQVDVQAVTDTPDLKIGGSDTSYATTIAEDTALDLTPLLSASFADLDGSEQRAIIIANPAGNATIYVNGVAVAGGGSYTIAWNAAGNDLETSTSGFPAISIQGGSNFSGDLNGITVTLSAQDTDADSTVTTATLTDAVTLDLHVTPVAGDIGVSGASTPEDTAVKFLQGVAVTDTDGSESITGIEVKGIPAGWVLKDAAGNTLTVTGGAYTLPAGDVTGGAYKDYTLTPPGHGSADAALTLDVTSTDVKEVDGVEVTSVVTVSRAQTVAVTAVAEVVGGDSNHDGEPDLTMNGDFVYTSQGKEDEWFTLNKDGFDLKSPWSNQDADGSETTYALLTPVLGGSSAIGSQFKYTDGSGEHTLTYTGTPVRIPVAALDTVQFKAAANVAGAFEIEIQALTVDTDPNTGTAVEAVSGSATLTNLIVQPVADPVTLAVDAPAVGKEDTSIALVIRPTSADPSETFNVTLSGIPAGARITYDGVDLAVAGGSVTITDFSSAKSLTITPPANSNADIPLLVSAVSVDAVAGLTTDVSDAKSLPLLVDVRGVADPVNLVVSNLDTTEAVLDAGDHKIALSGLVSAAATDTDGSETVNLVITGLPSGVSIEGLTFMGGTGAGRVWSGSPAAVAAAALVVGEANYSGTFAFTVRAVSTENDGNSLSGTAQTVTVQVAPSPEATLATQTAALEDTRTHVDFGLAAQNGDANETLSALWIKADSLAGQPFTLYLGTTPLSAALTANAGGWYELTAAQAADVYVQGDANSNAGGSITVRYAVTDPSNDGTLAAVTTWSADTAYAIGVAAVTDATTSVNDYAGGVIAGTATVSVNVTVTQADDPGAGNAKDVDGSEKLLHFIIDGVPVGVSVVGGRYIGNTESNDNTGRWILDVPDTAFTAPSLQQTVQFALDGSAAQLADLDQAITITAYTQDAGGAERTSSTTWTLRTAADFDDSGSTPTAPSDITEWAATHAGLTEDTPATLASLVDAHVSGSSPFAVTVTGLPAGSVVNGMTLTMVGGQEIWTAQAGGGDADLQSLLNGITITPPPNWNDNQGVFSFTTTLTTYDASGARQDASLSVQPAVTPVSDDISLGVGAPDVDEDHAAAITLNLSNPQDGSHSQLIGGTLYLKLDESGMETAGGVLSLGGTPLAKSAVSGVAGVPDGDYYVITGVHSTDALALSYQPAANASGTVSYAAYVQGQEDNAANVTTSTAAGSFDVHPVNDGVTLTVASAAGLEDQRIQLSIGVANPDASEAIASVVLSNVPDGFLVFCGADAASAALASDLGGGSWGLALSGGVLPAYVALQPLENWSGTLSDLHVEVWSGESSLDPVSTSATAQVTVAGVADGITFQPTLSFGTEGHIVALNLNSTMHDTDGSETATLAIHGLGAHAAFYAGTSLLVAAYDTFGDTYTLSGLSPAQVSALGVVQGGGDYALTVTAYTTDSPGGDVSASSNASLTLKLSDVLATSGDDVLLYDGKPLDGLGGTDTVQLRLGENLDFSGLVDLKNVERLDLMPSGQNHSVSNLSLQDVLDISGSGKTLAILGDAGDYVGLKDGTGSDQWLLSGSETSGGHSFDVYTNAYDAAVKVLIEQQVQRHID